MTYRLLIGLPSYNEAETIAKVASDIDQALLTLPFPVDAVLLNCDNASTDNTTGRFLEATTHFPKRVVTTEHAAGKGTNTVAILQHVTDDSFDAVISVDTDLAEVPQEWIHGLAEALHEGADYCYPIRPPRWNGGDLTYHLAYPALAGVYGVDLREPLCGDVALSRRAAQKVLSEQWTDGDLRYGGDFLIASLATTEAWTCISLGAKRWNKLRSFSGVTDDDYRMGGKFRENALSVRHRARARIAAGPPPTRLVPMGVRTPVDSAFVVPDRDHDIDRLARGTASRLRRDAEEHAFLMFAPNIASKLADLATADDAMQGLPWPLWRDVLATWISPEAMGAGGAVPVGLLETLFLSRVVAHHHEIAGKPGWYQSVVEQGLDLFDHRHDLWQTT